MTTCMTTSTRILAVLGAVALTWESAHGTPIEDNPVTCGAKTIPLGHAHPAFGAPVPYIECPVADNHTTNVRRELEVTNGDIAHLELYFQAKMETNFNVLRKAPYKKAVTNTVPWPGSYWPANQDSINFQWNGPNTMSAAEKYATAYGLDVKKFADNISKNNGILSLSSHLSCRETHECERLNDGSICGKRQGDNKGFCIPVWYGLCHAWAAAALLEPEPQCAVTKDKVTFEVSDIKALITEIYDGVGVNTVFTGSRFNGPDSPGKIDQYGRFHDPARRDLGAGFFHIAIANILGRHKKPFVVDVTAGEQVWNQPVLGYEVLQMTVLDKKKASEKYFKTRDYPFNRGAKYLAYVQTKLSWIAESIEDGPLVSTNRAGGFIVSATYEYLLELDRSYKIIGGEWIGNSRYDHPDFLWFPTTTPDASSTTAAGLKYKDVKELLNASIKC